MTDSYVYFIKPVGMSGPIKIGYSRAPQRRLIALASWSPFPLEVVATVPGDGNLERRFHSAFHEFHLHREWFRAEPELVAAVSALMAGKPVEEVVDLFTARPGHTPAVSKKELAWRRNPDGRLRCSYSHRLGWAERKSGLRIPSDVREIMWRWEGRDEPSQRPSEAEFARLEEFIASAKAAA